MACQCIRCRKLFEMSFCPECEALSIQTLAEIMEKKLKIEKHNLTNRSSRQDEIDALSEAIHNEPAMGIGINPPSLKIPNK